jgi:hypothetical protein
MGLNSDNNKPPTPEEEDILKWCSAALFGGGAETVSPLLSHTLFFRKTNFYQTVSVTTTFFLMMTLHPGAQRRAQDEIDRVIGKDRLPTVEDKKFLPYTMAIIMELLRFAPVAPLGKELFCPIAPTFSDVQLYRSTAPCYAK